MRVVLLLPLLLCACGGPPPPLSSGASSNLECAPFARQMSGIALYGDAYTWWDQADGRYRRTSEPEPGQVLVFRRTSRLPSGHVSVVASIASQREIRVTQANWVHRRITRDEPVIDVSADHDWSAVRVWWAPSHTMGATTYPTYGFIGPADARSHSDLVATAEP